MELKSLVTAPFKFTAVPVSVLTLIIYGLLFTSVLVTDETPGIPVDLKGLNLNEAYNDLHRVSSGVLRHTRLLRRLHSNELHI